MRRNGYAEISACGKYRYKLGGDINPANADLLCKDAPRDVPILWIMLNPSTADANTDDATIKTITIFSERWGYGRLMVGNLYAYRATDPKELVAAWRGGLNIVGPRNADALAEMTSEVRDASGKIMVAWGAGFEVPKPMAVYHRTQVARWVGSDLYCLKTTKLGWPTHPLYQPHHLTPQPWSAP